MKILFCNPKNSSGKSHSRKGMYVPLGILSIATVLKENLGDRISITVIDEDVEEIGQDRYADFDLVGFYSTSFNYSNCVLYATAAKAAGCKIMLGGPHPSILAENIMRNQTCFDYVVKFEAERSILQLVQYLMQTDEVPERTSIPNLVFQESSAIVANAGSLENKLFDLPIPSREFIRFNRYIDNYRKIYPDKASVRPGSIYSSKGCSWRDKTGGCVFCARLEEGIRFREIEQIWMEIEMLQEQYGVNSIWDISDDNLNNIDWFKRFVKARPASCRDLSFFIYSRVNCIKPEIIPYLHELRVEEIFLGVESGDNRVLQQSFKGQTARSALRAVSLLKESNITYFPSFILGLPGESAESMENTYQLCKQMAEIGGLERLGCTILIPIPGSAAFNMLLADKELSTDLAMVDDIDLAALERIWIERFTNADYQEVLAYRDKINELMKNFMVFGGRSD